MSFDLTPVDMVIARHLEKATLCLLLLSPDSAASEYVKNELNFAQNHRIPIQVLLLQKFPIPVDIEMMTGRFHRIEMIGDYHKELIKSLPGEIFYKEELDNPGTQQGRVKDHPLFSTGELQSDWQGTRRYCGAHKYLYLNF